MPSSHSILITLSMLVSLQTTTTAAEMEHITLGVGLSHFLSVEGGLSQKVEIKVTGDKVASVDVVNRRRLYLVGRRAGNVILSFTALDGKRHQYQLNVVKPTKEMLEPAGTKLIDIGVGQARFINVPVNFLDKKLGTPLLAQSNFKVLHYDLLSLKHVVVRGVRTGYSDFIFLSSADVLTKLRFRVTNSRHYDPGEQKPEKLSLVVGESKTLMLPQVFHNSRSRVILTRPALIEIEGETSNDIYRPRGETAVFRVGRRW